MIQQRRTFFKTIFGAAAAIIAAPLIPLVEKLPVRYANHLIPLIRRTMPSLIAADIVGVQPMTGPTGTVFKMKLISKKRYR